jgi:type I restriction enzyme S subunit
MLSARNIESGRITLDNFRYISKKDFDRENKRTQITPGDVLLTIVGTIGRTAVVPDKMKSFTVQRSVAALTPIDMLPKFLMYQFQSPFVSRYFDENARGTAQKGIYLKTLSQVPIRVAPKDEQKRIVAEIEKQFSRLDEAIENVKRIKANLKRYKAAVLKAAVEGNLTEKWRAENPDVEPASELLERILTERRKKWEEAELAKMKAKGKIPKDDKWKRKYKEPFPPETTELNPLPDSWAWATVDQIASPEPNPITDGPFGSNLKTEHYTNKGPRVIRLQNIGYAEFIDEKAHISDRHYESLIKHSVVPGDVIIAALGRPAPRACLTPPWIGKAIVKADCIRLRTSPCTESGYIMYALNSDPVQKKTESIVHGIGRPRLNLGEIKSLAIPVPPKHEQKTILNEIEYRLSVSQEIIDQVEKNLNMVDRLRQSILKKAFSGRLVSQDENDEPMGNIMG